MIDSKALLADLQQRVKRLTEDLRERCEEHPGLESPLREEFVKAKQRERTAQPYEAWREDLLTQIAVAWVLACVFVRFLEDNELVDSPRLAGSGPHLQLARDHEEHFFQHHPKDTVREYLLDVFADAARLPGLASLLDPAHNPLFLLGPSADASRDLLDFWRRTDVAREGGVLVHDFADPGWSTRFLGDLYQDLSDAAKSRYALLQTPIFVEEFLLDRTLEPAIQEFGFGEVRLVDPACGSGHFLLGAFERLFARHAEAEPATEPRALAQRALDQIAGVDLNPYAVAIARFRMLLAALGACRITRLREAPAFAVHVAAGDSLLHGTRPHTEGGIQGGMFDDPLKHHHYATEDAANVERLLSQRYHVVVGNPPYITPKDAALNQLYRARFASCYRQYSLAVPFTERFFDLAIAPAFGETTPAGFVGMITANSFMTREFGRRLVEEYIPRWDLTHVVDTRFARIPGHDTPTVILIGRCRGPIAGSIRAVMGIRGEHPTDSDPALGAVWTEIVSCVDRPGFNGVYVSAVGLPRVRFHAHPWSIGGGGASELKSRLETRAAAVLGSLIDAIGRTTVVGEDSAWIMDRSSGTRAGIAGYLIDFVVGDCVRDWSLYQLPVVVYPYESLGGRHIAAESALVTGYLWPYRVALSSRSVFGKTLPDMGRPWFEHLEHYTDKLAWPLSMTFAFVATHNHFVLDRGGKLFNRSAPVIKLPAGASEAEHLVLLGLLNSSAACFWMKQVFHNKGIRGEAGGTTAERWEQFIEHDGTKIRQFPVPKNAPVEIARVLDGLAREHRVQLPGALAAEEVPSAAALRAGRERAIAIREEMIALQEELDWSCYELYGQLDEGLCAKPDEIPRVKLGERAFEIVLARRLAAGEIETKWFERHGSSPITEILSHWPAPYQALVQRRVEAIEKNPSIALIEQPEYKRRWNDEPWEEQEQRALRRWLGDRLEDRRYWPEPRLVSAARLADSVRTDAEFLQVAELYRGAPDFDLTRLVVELVEEEGVPFLPVLRYKPSGLRKRELWERTWEKQRLEDEIDARRLSEADSRATKAREVGTIEVPPKYASADFLKGSFWKLRGKLDVPKERFVLYPQAERDADPTPVLTWAGFDALQQAKALAAYALTMKQEEGWTAERLTPLLAGLLELLPWLRQWHNDLEPVSGQRLGDYFAQFLNEECLALSLTLEDLRAWQPPQRSTRRRRGGRSA